MPPLRSVSFRFLMASALLLPAMWLARARLPRGKEWVLLVVLGTFMMALPFSLIAWAQQRMSSAVTSILFAASPLMTLGLEAWMSRGKTRMRLPPRAFAGALVGLAGVGLVMVHAVSGIEGAAVPAMTVLLVAVFGAASTIVAKDRLKEIPVLTVAATETLFSGMFLGVLSLVFERHRATDWTQGTVVALLFLGLFSSALCFLLFYWLLLRIEPYQLASRYLLMPVVALAEGSFLLHEAVSRLEIVGCAAVLLSVTLVLSADSGRTGVTPTRNS
jgi:drug/metabolite transporter (DMT)-like permease